MKNHNNISVNAENVFDKIQHPLMMKKFLENRNICKLHQRDEEHLQKKYLQLILCLVVRRGTFPLRMGTQERYMLLLLLFSMGLDVLARKMRYAKEVKDVWIGKEEINLILFAQSMIVYE